MNHRNALLLLYFSLTLLIFGCKRHDSSQLQTVFEASDSLETVTYEEGIEWWKSLESLSPYVRVDEVGNTDAGLPLHVVMVSADRNFSLHHTIEHRKSVVLINNAIHPGEPDGVDASMLFVRDLINREDYEEAYSNIVFLIIPFYNVGGALNRNCCSRANQNGPKSYGFRGNARNLDLNRDFTKADSRNAQSFLEFFGDWNPDVYLETHVSNGADYPYTMTYLISHPDKLTPPMNSDMNTFIAEPLKRYMSDLGDEMTPYVNVFGTTPDSGFVAFYDSPRYSTGYAALHHSFGLLTETHMLKPFKDRVESTYRFMLGLAEAVALNHDSIKASRDAAVSFCQSQSTFVLDWETDFDNPSELLFNGYKAYYDSSSVTGEPQLYYDKKTEWTKTISYFDKLKPTIQVQAPKAYLVPLAWKEVIDRLDWNHIAYKIIQEDTSLDVAVYHIESYETNETPFEGHFFHKSTMVDSFHQEINVRSGEYALVPLNQDGRRFIIEMLEPEGPDSYFNWNFFDEVLQQKEWFSSYVFEPEAQQMLNDTALSKRFKTYVDGHPNIQGNPWAKLYYLYKQSDHFERDRFMIYPVFRVEASK